MNGQGPSFTKSKIMKADQEATRPIDLKHNQPPTLMRKVIKMADTKHGREELHARKLPRQGKEEQFPSLATKEDPDLQEHPS